MTQTSTPSPLPSNNPSPAADTRQDPAMRSLFKMSRTAGVGLQDYAAVNVLAVIGVLLGGASVLAFIFADVTIMLAIPVLALAVSLVALYQIRNSNGTQTGAGWATLGVLLALGLGGANVFGRMTDAKQESRDRVVVNEIVKSLEKHLMAKDSKAAYDLFDERFKADVAFESFDRTVGFRVANMFGEKKIVEFGTGPEMFFETDKATGIRFAQALLIVYADGTFADGSRMRSEQPIVLQQIGSDWKIHQIPAWFEATAKPKK